MPHKKLSPSVAGLERFMQRWDLSRRKAAEELGVSERMVYWYLSGTHQVPKSIILLIKALDENWSLRR